MGLFDGIKQMKKNNDDFELFDGTINLDSPYIRETAAHEVGHVVVSEILEPGSVSVVSINATGEGHFGTTIIRRPEASRAEADGQSIL